MEQIDFDKPNDKSIKQQFVMFRKLQDSKFMVPDHGPSKNTTLPVKRL